jgi:hypothetical protein
MAKAENRFKEARELYRAAQVELAKWKESQADEVLFLKNELEEALLDLKQAVIELNTADAERYIDEVSLLITELQSRRAE